MPKESPVYFKKTGWGENQESSTGKQIRWGVENKAQNRQVRQTVKKKAGKLVQCTVDDLLEEE